MSDGGALRHTFDVVLAFDAHERMGFGHAARCVRIAELIEQSHPAVRVGIIGELTQAVRERVLGKLPRAVLLAPDATPRARVGVVDRLADDEDPEAFDVSLTERLARTCDRVIALATGAHAVTLPSGATLVGYQPGGPAGHPPELYWGLEYAPVAATVPAERPPPEPGRVLVALGGARDDRCLRSVLAGCSHLEGVDVIDVLLSPVMPVARAELVALDARIVLHENVASVASLIGAAELVVTSYGHLMWEAMALGAATCVLGQKSFQVEWSERLCRAGCIVAAGDARTAGEVAIREALRETRRSASALRARGRGLVDGRGLSRVAELVSASLGTAAAPRAEQCSRPPSD
jgi:spore coat polysaccharide biosynthesis predicted glycosyltransferase SpsG